jgi:hypothetical protein
MHFRINRGVELMWIFLVSMRKQNTGIALESPDQGASAKERLRDTE